MKKITLAILCIGLMGFSNAGRLIDNTVVWDSSGTGMAGRKLIVRLVDDVPVPIQWPAGRVSGINRSAALALMSEFGFRSFA